MASDVNPNLPLVRRLEAVGFRAWPAADIRYDGSWQLRMTAGHPSRRANSLVPLDPRDIRDIAGRLSQARDMFTKAGRRFAIKETPLCPPQLVALLEQQGFKPEGETSVQTANIAGMDLGNGQDHLPSHDIERFVEACLAVEPDKGASRDALGRLFSAIEPEAGLFFIEDEVEGPRAVALCIHDNDLAGIQQVAVVKHLRRQGLATEILSSALLWAKLRGARQAWLQVEAANDPAKALYRGFGFKEAYRYRYWVKD
ncbi:GNAT family N-acetyltransferase [Rhizobium sp. PAMB 3174]